MSVTVQSVGPKVYQNAVVTKDYVFTVTAGLSLALVVTLNFGAGVTGITCTWDQGGTNQAMTELLTKTFAGAIVSSIFGLRAPTVGIAKTLRVSWTTLSEVFIDAVAFEGVDQTSDAAAFPHTAGFAAITTPGTVNIPSAIGNIVIACETPLGVGGANTGTLIYNDHVSGAVINAMAEYDAGAPLVTIGVTGDSAFTLAAVDVAAGSAPPPSILPVWTLLPGRRKKKDR